MARYVWRNGEFVDPTTNQPMDLPFKGQITLPHMRGDIQPYTSPITGQIVDGRAARREELKRHNCIEAGDKPRLNRGKVRNEKFARKHGLKWAGD